VRETKLHQERMIPMVKSGLIGARIDDASANKSVAEHVGEGMERVTVGKRRWRGGTRKEIKYLMGEDRKWRANGGYRRAKPRERNKPREGHHGHPISQRGSGSARWENGRTFRSVGLTDLDARGANGRDGTHLPTSAAIGEPFDGGLEGGEGNSLTGRGSYRTAERFGAPRSV